MRELKGDLLLSTILNHLDFGKIESLDIEKINLDAVAIHATAQAKIAIITKKELISKSVSQIQIGACQLNSYYLFLYNYWHLGIR